MQETDLYPPIKALFEAQGYDVKSEISDCDMVARRGDEAPVIVELKLRLSLALLVQGTDRQAMSDAVYLAVPSGKGARWRGQLRDMIGLCRRLGLGVMSVRFGSGAPLVEVHLDPAPYRPRKSNPRKNALLREFSRRVGDPNTGGQTRRPIVTAYRQDALRIAVFLGRAGSGRPRDLAAQLGVKNAAAILQKDHYGWFLRVSRGLYKLTPKGQDALALYGDVIATLGVAEGPTDPKG